MRRVLIDWDFTAHGLWLIGEPREDSNSLHIVGDASGNNVVGRSSADTSWNELLSSSLLERLQSWNDRGSSLARRTMDVEESSILWNMFYDEGRVLAESVQLELGEQWQILWAAHGAWHFV